MADDLNKQREAIRALVPEAIAAVAEIMRSPRRNAQSRLAAARGILERAGLKPVQHFAHDGTLQISDISAALERGRMRAARLEPDTEDQSAREAGE